MIASRAPPTYLFFAACLAGAAKTEVTDDKAGPLLFAAADFLGFLISRFDLI